ncbi:MAG TPA: hypothetical protein VGB02_12150 [Pyrinomonadaceae bacterium]|jgi:hypothetical protein
MFDWIRRIFGRNIPPAHILPDYARLYFENLRGEYQSLTPTQVAAHPQVVEIIERILAKDNIALEWNDLYTFDLSLAKLQSLAKLPRIAWNLRSRYRDVAGLREYEAYLASKPPELAPNAGANEADLRADIEFLLNQLHLRYSMTPIHESVRDRLSKAVTVIILVGLFVVIAFVLLANNPYSQDYIRPATFIIVLIVGAMGGLVSMQQRFQSVSNEGDPIHNISELARGWFSIFLSPISGAIFAAVLYFAISGKLLEGALFPIINQGGEGSGRFVFFIQETVPKDGVAFAKLMIWSFIAGFAERFVPDTLSRFVQKQETTSAGTT